jgi:hypothetical protein
MPANELPQPDPLAIRTPCPKKWEELSGGGAKRFCSECSLHVHDAAQLSEREARALVADAQERVCMRLEYDAAGRLRFRDTQRTPARARHPLVRWAVSAAAGLLAACNGNVTPPPGAVGGIQDPGSGPSRLGEATTVELGDVAVPQQPEVMGGVTEQPPEVMGVVAPRPPEIMGKVGPALLPPAPAPVPAQDRE